MTDPGHPSTGLPAMARIWLGGRAEEVRRQLGGLLPPVARPPTGWLDAILVAPRDVEEWAYFLGKHAPRLRPTGQAWLVGASPPCWNERDAQSAAARCGLSPVRRTHPAPGLVADVFEVAPGAAGPVEALRAGVIGRSDETAHRQKGK